MENKKSFAQKVSDRPCGISADKISIGAEVQSGRQEPPALSVRGLHGLVFDVVGQRFVIFAPGIRVVAVVVSRPDDHPFRCKVCNN